jgi:hypothetical protein
MGNGIGNFSAPGYRFATGNTVYARAYAINTGGIAYGDTIRFATHTTILSLNTTAAASTNAITVAFSFKTAQNISGLTPANFSVSRQWSYRCCCYRYSRCIKFFYGHCSYRNREWNAWFEFYK